MATSSLQSQAVQLPADTTANRPTAANGMLRYNTSTLEAEGYINGTWTPIVTESVLGLNVVTEDESNGNLDVTFYPSDATATLSLSDPNINVTFGIETASYQIDSNGFFKVVY